MVKLVVSIPATLLCFKGLRAVSNSSVVKSESLMALLKDIKCSVKLVETGGTFSARERPTFLKKELNSFAVCFVKYNNVLLIFSTLGNVLFFPLFLSLFVTISWYFLKISIFFYIKIVF